MKIKKLVSVFMMGVMLASSTPVNVFANSGDIASDISGDDITASGSAVGMADDNTNEGKAAKTEYPYTFFCCI